MELIIGRRSSLGAAPSASLVYAVLAQADEKAVVRDSLRQLDGYEVENVRDQELLEPLAERAIAPVLAGLTTLGRRFTPVGYVDNVRQQVRLVRRRLGRRRRPLPGRPGRHRGAGRRWPSSSFFV